MRINYSHLFQSWEAATRPSATTVRMTRRTLKYLADAAGADDWRSLDVSPEQHAVVMLDAAMAKTSLSAQSRSNYRGYLRRLCRFAAKEGIDLADDTRLDLWPPAPIDNGTPRRAQVAYGRFVRWAIGRGVWPRSVRPEHPRDWAMHERSLSNQHWRQDYRWLESAWNGLAGSDGLLMIEFPPLPPKLNDRYALPRREWPAHLRSEWQRMCRDASVPLRKGGMRAWRPVTRENYEKRLSQFLGWVVSEQPDAEPQKESWGSLLSVERCQAYLNWLVLRSGKKHLNPGHTAFLRMLRGFHRFLLGSPKEVVQSFSELCRRCEVEERDKALRIAPFPAVQKGLRDLLALVRESMKSSKRLGDNYLATLQVDAIILGLLVTRALRRLNVTGIRVGTNLLKTASGFELRFSSDEMKGHRKFETFVPSELVPVVEDYLRRGYRALTGRAPTDGDVLLVTRRGTPFDASSFGQRVRHLSKKWVGKPLNPHLFRHIVATHAAQVLRMTPTELAAFLAHRSVMTVMRYYEVTNPSRAAQRFDAMRSDPSVAGAAA